MEDSQVFDRQIAAAYQHLHELHELIERSGPSPEQESALGEALKSLSASLDELRRQAESQREVALEAQHDSEERFRTLAAFAPVAIYMTDARGDCHYVNERWCEMAGLSPDEAMGQGWVKGLAEEDRERVASAWYAMTQSQGHWGLEYRFRTPAGKTTWVFGHATRLFNRRGQLAGYIGTNVDITALKQAESQREAALAERERLLVQAQRDRESIAALAKTLKRERDTLQTIMESTHAHLAYLDPDFNFVRVNSAYAQGSGHSQEELIGRNHFDLFPNAENQAIFEQVRDSGQPAVFHAKPFEYADQPERGVSYWDWSLVPVKKEEDGEEDGQVRGLVFSLLDVTHQVRAEQERERHTDELNAIFTSINEAVIVFDANSRVARANPTAHAIYGAELVGADRATVTRKLFLRHPDGRPVMAHELAAARALRGEQVRGERFILTSADGRDVHILASAAPLLADGRPVGSVVVWHDITERERLLADLAAERARLEAIIDNAPEAIVVVDSACRIVLANPATEQLYGRSLPYGEDFNDQVALALRHPDGTPCAPRDLPFTRSVLDGETLTSLDMAIAWPDGQRRDLLVSSAPIRDDAGRASGAVGIFQDITQRKQAEEKLKATLAENEVLMREIYHRVKNNIQTLISLMDMQAEFITDPDTQAMIRELQVRARTMSLVHEQLYQSGNVAQIDFGAYLNDLIANLSRAFWADRPIVWNIDAADVPLSVDIAIPCGLIVNELLTNALKYAFPNAQPVVERGETECKIRVEFRAEGNQYRLVVADNGVGLPPGLDWSKTNSLGLQLINILACYQLGGQVEVDTQAGTAFKITFAEREKK